jgi:hypothetical protein
MLLDAIATAAAASPLQKLISSSSSSSGPTSYSLSLSWLPHLQILHHHCLPLLVSVVVAVAAGVR